MPYNLELHEHLLSLGYEYSRIEADFDDGDAENGPGTGGHCAYDQYKGPDEYVYTDGVTVDRQLRDLAQEEFEEKMFGDVDNKA